MELKTFTVYVILKVSYPASFQLFLYFLTWQSKKLKFTNLSFFLLKPLANLLQFVLNFLSLLHTTSQKFLLVCCQTVHLLVLITHLCNPVIHKSPFWVRKISYQFLYFPLYCFDCCFLWLQFLTKTLQKCAYAILKFINIKQKDILVIFKTFCHNMVISTDYEIICIAKIGCLSLKHLGTALVNTAARAFLEDFD